MVPLSDIGDTIHRKHARCATVLLVSVLVAAQVALSDPGAALAAPFVEQSELLGHGAGFGGSGNVGDHAVALSADGNTALVGAPSGTQTEPSYALIFTRSGSTWSQPEALVPEVEPGVDRVPVQGFGASVALSANGSTAIVGGMYGDAYVFEREGSSWRRTWIEPPRETEGYERFGEAVALSEDGNTLIIGDPFGSPEDFDGSAWIYSRSGTTWTIQAGPLHGEEKINPLGNEDDFGSTVALSGDGNTAIVGADGENGALSSALGAAWVYKRNGSTWSQDGPRLNPPGEQPGGIFGRSVALSGDGSRALIGTGSEKNEGSGAWIFDRGPSDWTAQARLSSGEDTNFNGSFGFTVALSRSGSTALIGGPETGPEETGEAWAFRCAPTGWIREPIQSPVSVKHGNFGYSVALAGEAATALVGAHGVPGESQQEGGAAFVFSGPPDSPGFCAGNVSLTGNAAGGSPNSTATTPIVESLRQTHPAWREGRAMATLARRRGGIPVGTTFEFSLNEPSRVRFTFAQLRIGRSLHGRCVPGPPHGRLHRCRLTVSRGILTLSAGAGLRHLRFDGRITKRHRLPPGFYTLTLTAETAAIKSVPRHLHFTIER